MRKNWNEAFFGHVSVIITGQLTETFINQAVREGIQIWDVKRLDEQRLVCSMMLQDIKRIKPILKKTSCKIHFNERYGFPFLIKRLMARSGIVIGIILCVAIVFILSNMVWHIEINGADAKVEEQIQKLLKKKHIHVGALEFLLPSLNTIETDLSSQLPKVTWVGVSKKGTTYRIDVVQKELPKKEKVTGPRDLIATKEATIHHVYVEKGQSVVSPDQVVQKGDLLVSGTIGKTEDPSFVSAKGEVIGETWYHATTTVPLKTDYETFTGATYTKHELSFFGWDVPIWGFQKQPFKYEKHERSTKNFRFLFWKLPIAYKKIDYRQYDHTNRQLSEAQALAIGKVDARDHLLRQLPEKSKVLQENVKSQQIVDGKLVLKIFFIVEEDIAKPRAFSTQERKEEIEKQNQEDSEE
ncbi:sporulation protein YqfD [Pullulanibacillus camelliae]|uniref:Sporulation protein YqfD n=1 Tax=Pullulanibacillus camelliae TaxID=1707096 RepID=A0A8J2YJK4_9BACL|nr:sporulation protein YqfD [Pullulanibacillus camelliae]GGE47162.1 sporulation protein YqfD [Pullulanibacillus camelliae]